MDGYAVLEKNLVDLVKEQQAKLGYRKETVSLYYPLSTLNHFFRCHVTADEMQEMLGEFVLSVKGRLGDIRVSHQGERFCFRLPEDMSEYVHSQMKESEFIRELVKLVSGHGIRIEQVKELFCAYSDHVVCERMDNGEFDYMLRFEDCDEDRYYYCFKDEGCHMIYHRFLPEDYRELF